MPDIPSSKHEGNEVFTGLYAATWRPVVIAIVFICISIIASHIDEIRRAHINSDLFLRYIDSLKYPLLILFFGLVFRKPITKFIDEADRVNVKGAEISRKQVLDGSSQDNLKNISVEADEALKTSPVTESAPDRSEEDLLHEQLSSPQAVVEYNRIYRMIYGTQLEALKKLMAYSDGLGEKDLQEFVNLHQARLPGSTYHDVNSLMQYPASELLVKYDHQHRTYHLTYAGFYFLNYLKEQGVLQADLNF